MGLVSLSAGGLETRPAGHDAGLPGAGCPGRGSVVRDHEARDRTEPRLEGLWREPRRSAERRGRPQADDRGNADHSWRSPHWLADSDALIRSAGAEVDYAPLGAPPPLISLEANAFVPWLSQSLGAKNASRERCR